MKRTLPNFLVLGSVLLFVFGAAAQAADPLPSWNDGPAKTSIVEFVGKVTSEGSLAFVPESERIATDSGAQPGRLNRAESMR